MRRFGVAVIAVFLALCGAAGATPPNTPTITEPGTDNMVLNAADVHMEAPTFSDPDGNSHTCTDWEIVTVSPPQVAWTAPCAVGVSRVHIHLGDGSFVNAHAGMQQLKFDTAYKVRVRFKDSAGEFSAWRERPFSTAPAGPPGVPSPIPWAARQSGYVVEVVATGFQLPMNIAMVPNPGNNPSDPFLYVTELYGKIKVVSRSGAVSDYATGLLNFNPTGNFPGSGEQGLAGIAIEPTTGDLFVSMVYEDTASPVNPKPHYSKVLRFHSNDGGKTGATQTVVKDFFGESTEHSHQISNTTIGPDGKLYQHMGDGFDSSTALNLNSYRGKVLRMNLDGTAPTDNPFYNASDGINARDFVFAYGLRNPFGGRLASRGRLPLQRGERAEHRPVRKGAGRPQLRMERRRHHDAQLRSLQLGAGTCPREPRIRAAGDLLRKRLPDREDVPRLHHGVRPDVRDGSPEPWQADQRFQPDVDRRLRRHDASAPDRIHGRREGDRQRHRGRP